VALRTVDALVGTDHELQTEVLETLSDARRYRRWLADLARPYLGAAPIEVGSGTGDYAVEWLPDVTSFTVTECDEARLLRLRRRFADDGRVRVAPLTLPAVTPARHTGAVALNVLEHVPDDVAALRSMGRLVRPGGHVVVLVPAFGFAMSRFDRSVGHLRRYTRAGLLAALRAAGLDEASTRYVNPVGLLSWLLVVRGLGATPRNGPLVRAFDRLVVPPQRWAERYGAPPFGQSVFGVARVAPTAQSSASWYQRASSSQIGLQRRARSLGPSAS
jgi:SAM-dependent methyltransferase